MEGRASQPGSLSAKRKAGPGGAQGTGQKARSCREVLFAPGEPAAAAERIPAAEDTRPRPAAGRSRVPGLPAPVVRAPGPCAQTLPSLTAKAAHCRASDCGHAGYSCQSQDTPVFPNVKRTETLSVERGDAAAADTTNLQHLTKS